ncbi:MAG: two-component system OmpR family response regulator [Polyangiales bacterium]|jgi:two-component system OmpR family response regulator
MRHILIADDEERIRDVVQYTLEREGFQVSLAADGQEALDALEKLDVDLVVLDVMMPRVDGLEVCRRLRQRASTPVLFLSAKAEEVDRIVGLELGGDDYLSKPFSPRELLARVKAILRRFAPPTPDEESQSAPLSHGPVRIDRARHQVTCSAEPIKLTATEFGALAALFERPGIVLSRSQLMQRAYAFDNHVTERTIDTHIRRIRAKFRPYGVDPIETVHGVGYKAADLRDA